MKLVGQVKSLNGVKPEGEATDYTGAVNVSRKLNHGGMLLDSRPLSSLRNLCNLRISGSLFPSFASVQSQLETRNPKPGTAEGEPIKVDQG